ncbi:MAG: NAD-dependent epimerase/dehydratase family protein [Desulfobacterales bacterium]|nr:MAG: NAD-dependent epimerase/dehydratase family protein [Desulfobacterales bacterium]
MEPSIKTDSPQKILVTGGGGFLGGAIVRRLVARGDHVVSFSRGFYKDLKSLGVDQIQGNVGNKMAVEQACQGIDLVFHVAAKPGVWGHYSDYHKTNVTGTQNIISGCIQHQVSRLIYTSSPSVIFDGTDMEGVDESVPYPHKHSAHYPETKAIAEKCVLKATSDHLMTVILRPHLIWGPRDTHFVPRIIKRAKRLVRVGNGRNLVDTIYIDNAAEAHVLAADMLEKNPALSGNIYFLSQDEPIPAWDMINAILRAAGLNPVKRSMPRRMAWLIGAVLEFVYQTFNIDGEPRMTRFLADELATAHWFDISAAKKDLGYVPRISIKEGLKHLENWLSK